MPAKCVTPAHPCRNCAARSTGICGVGTPGELPRLAAVSTIVEFRRGESFIDEGDPATYVYIVLVGSAKLYKALPDGSRQIIGFGYATTLLGLTGDETYDLTVEAIEDIRMCHIPSAQLHVAAGELSAMGLRLLDMAMADLGRAQDHALLLGRKTAVEKVASFLILLASQSKSSRVPQRHVHLSMTRVDIGDHLGLTPETVSRSLAILLRDGVISTSNAQHIIVRDPARLASLANAERGEFAYLRTELPFHPPTPPVIQPSLSHAFPGKPSHWHRHLQTFATAHPAGPERRRRDWGSAVTTKAGAFP